MSSTPLFQQEFFLSIVTPFLPTVELCNFRLVNKQSNYFAVKCLSVTLALARKIDTITKCFELVHVQTSVYDLEYLKNKRAIPRFLEDTFTKLDIANRVTKVFLSTQQEMNNYEKMKALKLMHKEVQQELKLKWQQNHEATPAFTPLKIGIDAPPLKEAAEHHKLLASQQPRSRRR